MELQVMWRRSYGGVPQDINSKARRPDRRVIQQVRHRPRGALLMTLSAFSLPSFAGGIAGVASGLPLGFQRGFARGPLSEFGIPRVLLGFQGDLTSGNLGGLRSG
jgi:hypothetical protein